MICKQYFLPFLLISTLLLSIPFSSFAQKDAYTTIRGKSTFNPGEEVRLKTIEDYISNKSTILTSDKISKNGDFSLTFKSNYIRLVQLEVRTSSVEFFAVPHYSYNFNVDMDPQLFELLDPAAYGGFLQLRSETLDTGDLNYKINRFSFFFENLLSTYSYNLIYKKDKESYFAIIDSVAKHFPIKYDPDNYYLSYIYYTLGTLDMIYYHKYPDTLYNRYFDNEYILYHHPAYMSLFNKFYDNYLYSSLRIPQSVLSEYINYTPDYNTLFNEVGKDRFLVNERIRELVIIKNLGTLYGNDEFDRGNIIQLLEYINKYTRFPDHKPIVKNLLEKLKENTGETPLPEITFKKDNGGNFKLDKLKGKWVYVHFFTSMCTDCIRDMLIIKELQEKYKEDIEFVSISLDFDNSKFTSFLQEYKMFDWTFLHFNGQYEWLRTLGISSLPDNILLDPEGNISMRHAPDPNTTLPLFLLRKFYKEKEIQNPMFRK